MPPTESGWPGAPSNGTCGEHPAFQGDTTFMGWLCLARQQVPRSVLAEFANLLRVNPSIKEVTGKTLMDVMAHWRKWVRTGEKVEAEYA